MGTDPSKVLGGMLGDWRGIFLTAESAPLAARFRVALSMLGCCLVENCSEVNSHLLAVHQLLFIVQFSQIIICEN